MILIGIDPDRSGGIAVVNCRDNSVRLLMSMPMVHNPVKAGTRLDAPGLYNLLQGAKSMGAQCVILESAIVRPQIGKNGAPVMTGGIGVTHQNYGAIRALAETVFNRPGVVIAWPSTWKKDMGLSADKDQSRVLATSLFPGHAPLLSKKKNVGLAEALLLTQWGNSVALKCISG